MFLVMKRSALVIILILSLMSGAFLEASTDLELYQIAKKNYVTSIFKNDKEKELKYLKELIKYGKQSDQDISKYQKELHRFSLNPKIKQETRNLPIKNNISRGNDIASGFEFEDQKDRDNFGRSVKKSAYVLNNSLIIGFDNRISKDDIKFTKTKNSEGYTYQLEITGKIENFNQQKLSMEDVRLIDVIKKSDNTIVVKMSDNNDLKVYYALNEKNLIVKISNNSVQSKELAVSKEVIQKQSKNLFKDNNVEKEDSQKLSAKGIDGKAKIIVIDAGHGGKDPGAVGPNNEYEKDVVLATGLYLRDILKNLGYIVYLTRDDDTFIELKDRTKIANKKHADLFISIHANAAPKGRARDAKGIETYFLSPARSDKAKSVAALENKEDIDAMDNFASQDILLTLLNRGKTIASQKMAIDVQGHILYQLRKTYGKDILDNGAREAPFWVLVGAQMPAVLVEMGYISHPEESQRLISPQYQQEVANGIAEGITAYFIHNR